MFIIWKTGYFQLGVQISLLQENMKELSEFKPRKVTIYLPHYSSDKGFKGNVVNQPSLFAGYQKIK